ncbi:MAG: hypothetical protein Q8N47_24175 [Bryobacterales bacterium]|nr:hypothetical protein [Bryobacterales bacterium]
MSTPQSKAKGGATTTQENVVELRPFQVSNVECTNPWDPTERVLEVSYDINDPNKRIRSGRIAYWAPDVLAKDGFVMVHSQKLKPDHYVHGVRNQVPMLDRWDGKIDKGFPDRIGKLVTADLSDILVRVEVWNNTNDSPGEPLKRGAGRTTVAGEWLSWASADVRVVAIVKAAWDTEWVIPYGDPDEPAKGKAGMNIEVKNVLEGTQARLSVRRINEIADPTTDYPYADYESEDQDGLDAVVKGNKVLLANGSKPYVKFLNFDEHWNYPGNNFYAFYIAFGDSGTVMLASERDYEKSEKACLHMRFTVFIHSPAYDLAETMKAAQRLHQFFRGGTKYYRSYLMIGPPKGAPDWAKHFHHRYLVFLLGHAACGCVHPDHPERTVGKGKKQKKVKLDVYHSGFVPDRNICPTEIEKTKAAKLSIKADEAHYHTRFGGCGNRSHVCNYLALGRKGKTSYAVGVWSMPAKDRTYLTLYQFAPQDGYKLSLSSRTPRILLWADGCRTILTTNLGEFFVNQTVPTKYYHGWEYSVIDDHSCSQIGLDVMTRFIKGTKKAPAPNEYDTTRIVQAYRDAARLGTRPRYYPRLMDSSGVLNPREDPAGKEAATK